MKQNKDRIFFILLIFMTVWLTSQNIRDACYYKSHFTTVSIRFLGSGVTKQNLKAALEKEKSRGTHTIPEITAWEWSERTQVKNKLLNRSARIAGITVFGDMTVTAPMDLVDGNYVTAEDKSGCVIDVSTAYSLYGTERAIGNIISIDNADYIIRGIVRTNNPVVLTQRHYSDLVYTNLEFIYSSADRKMGEGLASDFILQNGLPSDYVAIDGNFYGGVLSSALCLPAWIFYLFISLSSIIYYYRQRKNCKICPFILYGILGLALLSGYGMILHYFTGQLFYLPEKILPTKWSDFSYWEKTYNTIRGQLRQIKYLAPNSKDVFLEYGIAGLLPDITALTVTYLLIYVQGKKVLTALKI